MDTCGWDTLDVDDEDLVTAINVAIKCLEVKL